MNAKPQRIVKKYPNRRLYDTERSRYVTLEDVRALVLEGADLKVVDAQTDEDITRHVLMQIITEHETRGGTTFTTDMLMQFIRLSQDVAQETFARYLDHSMRFFREQQQRAREQMQDAFTGKTLAEVAQRNLEFWQSVQENFLRAVGVPAGTAKKTEHDADAKRPPARPPGNSRGGEP
jgi:polyhydroxyalkanoate synthesis repressor PhaR